MKFSDIYKANNKAFTLVELSIVLIIIGLIIGGVLVGQDMVNAAKSRSTVAQLEKTQTAVNTFREKYGQLPGDYDLASANLSETTQDGDGNGSIYELAGLPVAAPTTVADGASTNEYSLFFAHLSLANLMSGAYDGSKTAVVPGSNFPKPKTGTGAMMVYSHTDGLNYCHIGLIETTAPEIVTAGVLRPDEAYAIDNKMDDGRPQLGIVRAKGGAVVEGAVVADNTSITAPACVTDATTAGEYKLAVLSQQCQLRVRLN